VGPLSINHEMAVDDGTIFYTSKLSEMMDMSSDDADLDHPQGSSAFRIELDPTIPS
jgi:hypothetical protein